MHASSAVALCLLQLQDPPALLALPRRRVAVVLPLHRLLLVEHAWCLTVMLLPQMRRHHYCWIISLPDTPLMHALLMALLRQMC